MTDFDYKTYSLEKLEDWLHDCISSGEATPQEVYDTITKVVKEQYYYYKDGASKTDELLRLLNGHKTLDLDLSSLYGDDVIQFNIDSAGNDLSDVDGLYTTQSPLYCDSDNSSEECKGSWNDFWEDDTTKVDDQSHFDYWYDYDRNDPNRPNPFKDKVVKWQLPVEQDLGSDDYYITFPDDLLEAANLKEGDKVEWVDNLDGSYTLKKVENHT